jgi:hypothetical protein
MTIDTSTNATLSLTDDYHLHLCRGILDVPRPKPHTQVLFLGPDTMACPLCVALGEHEDLREAVREALDSVDNAHSVLEDVDSSLSSLGSSLDDVYNSFESAMGELEDAKDSANNLTVSDAVKELEHLRQTLRVMTRK